MDELEEQIAKYDEQIDKFQQSKGPITLVDIARILFAVDRKLSAVHKEVQRLYLDFKGLEDQYESKHKIY